MEKYKELKQLVDSLEADATKFYTKHNNAAGTRLRVGLQQAKEIAQSLRLDVVNVKSERK